MGFQNVNGWAQDTNWMLYPKEGNNKEVSQKLPTNKSTKGNVKIEADQRLEGLLEKEIRIDEANGTINGYRIQIFYGSGAGSKTKAKEIQSEFISSFPEVPAYLLFQSPNFKIRVGDFRTKLEAQKFLVDCKENFGNAFIVKDDIKMPMMLNSQEN